VTAERPWRACFDPSGAGEWDELLGTLAEVEDRSRELADDPGFRGSEGHVCFVAFNHLTGEESDCRELHGEVGQILKGWAGERGIKLRFRR
jgi:hypothetical protein